jgi:hypothetical protein
MSPDFVVFYRSGERLPEGYVAQWVRYERQHPTRENASQVSRYEWDCSGGRYRQVQVSAYPRNNMIGVPVDGPSSGEWMYPIPSTAGEALEQKACSPD